MRGHLYSVKPVFKGHSHDRTPSIEYNPCSRDTTDDRTSTMQSQVSFKRYSDERTDYVQYNLSLRDTLMKVSPSIQ